MDAALVVLSAFLQTLEEKLASTEFRDYINNRKLNGTPLAAAETTRPALQAVPDDADQKQINNPAVKQLLDQLKDAVFDAEDLLDEISYDSLRCKVENTQAENITNQVSNFLSSTFRSFYAEINSKMEILCRRLQFLAFLQRDIHGLQTHGNLLHKVKNSKDDVKNWKDVHGISDAGKNGILLLSDRDLKLTKIVLEMQLGIEGVGTMFWSFVKEEYWFYIVLQGWQSYLLREFGEYSLNHFRGSRLLVSSVMKEKRSNITGNSYSLLDNNVSLLVVLVIGLMEVLDWRGKMTSKLHLSDGNIPIDPEFQHGYTFNQHKRKKTAQRVSSFVVSTIVFLGIFFDIWSQLSIIQVQPLHKERGPLSILLPLFGLLGFMVFVCAVATMILVRAPFTRMQKAMLIFWAILMHLQSAMSISAALFVPLVGVLFMGSRMLLEKTITK